MTVATTGAAAVPAHEREAPDIVGRYKIVRLIGEGGMGAVFEAEQDQPRRTVALKVIKPGMASPPLLKRFEQEAQALGRLQHPGIAQIYEAGTADTGYGPQPYFAMEFIRGEDLRSFVASRHANTRDRLEIMAKVCEAVHHAHQRGLIHRDLKPGNILVDETGQPKILDFGVARVTDRDSQATSQTDVGQLIGTLAYMSPEQVLADPLELDIRSDVYALGVILYELLAERLPYNLSNKLHEALLAIREEDPARLSSINRGYRGDIETIVAKSLEKNKTRRYSSASELAADIRRYLSNDPIVARPPTVTYQLQKFAIRHKALVAGLASVFTVLVAGIIASTWQAARAMRAEHAAMVQRDRAMQAEAATHKEMDRAMAAERLAAGAEMQARKERDIAMAQKQRADMESATAKAISDFLQRGLFEQASGAQPGGNSNVTIRAALDRAAAQIQHKYDKQPLVEAGVREYIAKAYRTLGAYPGSQQQLERALDLRRPAQGEEHPDTLQTMSTLGAVFLVQNKLAEAEPLLTKVREIRVRTLGMDNADSVESAILLAALYQAQGKLDQAVAALKAAVDVDRRIRGAQDKETLSTMMRLVQVYAGQRRFEDALELTNRVEDLARRAYGDRDEMVRAAQTAAGALQLALGAKGGRQATPADLAKLGAQMSGLSLESAKSLPEMMQLVLAHANALLLQGRFGEAQSDLLKAMDIARQSGAESTYAVALMSMLVPAYAQDRKYAEAESYMAKILAVERPNGEDQTAVLTALRGLANIYRMAGMYAKAEPHLDSLVALARRNPGEGAGQTRADMGLRAQNYVAQKKYAQAEDAYAEILDVQRRLVGQEALNTLISESNIGWVRLQQRKFPEAESILRHASSVLERTASDSWERFDCQNLLGQSLAGQAKYAEAETPMLAGYEGMSRRKPTPQAGGSLATVNDAGQAIVNLYQAWGRAEKAAEWKSKLAAPN
jgi:tetratricopeptide (TPR) repeat protein/predicted Ser/Thr protein kinase